MLSDLSWKQDWKTKTQARWVAPPFSIVATRDSAGLTYTVWKGKSEHGRMAEMVGTYFSPEEARQAAEKKVRDIQKTKESVSQWAQGVFV